MVLQIFLHLFHYCRLLNINCLLSRLTFLLIKMYWDLECFLWFCFCKFNLFTFFIILLLETIKSYSSLITSRFFEILLCVLFDIVVKKKITNVCNFVYTFEEMWPFISFYHQMNHICMFIVFSGIGFQGNKSMKSVWKTLFYFKFTIGTIYR